MSLREINQRKVNTDFVCLQTQERGGILSVATSGGLTFAEYAVEPSGKKPLGLQLNDIEHINLYREYDPRRIRRTDMPCGTVGIGQGQYQTDWLHLIGVVNAGDRAYVGPSGTVTNYSGFGSAEIGFFTSVLKADPHFIVFRGLGFTTSYMDCVTKQVVVENDPANMICLPSPGFINVNINF